MLDKILSAFLAMIGGAMIIASLFIMFAEKDAAGFFLFICGGAVAYAAGRIAGGPVRSFEEQYRDYGPN